MIQTVVRTLLLFSLVFFSGCGGGGDSSAPSSDSSSDSQPSSDSPSGEDTMGSGAEMAGSEMAGGEMEMNEQDMAGMEMGEPGASDGSSSSGGSSSGGSSSGEPGDPSMMMEAGMMEPGSEGGPGGRPRKPARPEKIADWTPQHITDAISEGDAKVVEIIDSFAEKKIGQATAVGQLTVWIAALTQKPETPGANIAGGSGSGGSGGSSGEEFLGGSEEMMMNDPGMNGGGFGGQRGPSGKEKIARALLDGLAINGTNGANAAVEQIFTGALDLGVPKDKAMEWAMVALMKNLSPANRSAQELLWKALTIPTPASPAVAADPKTAPKKEKPLQERAKDLHLGFVVASMNSLLGAEASPAKGTQNNNMMMGSGEMEGFEGSGGPLMEMPGGPGMNNNPQGGNQPPAQPLQIPQVSIKQDEATAAVSYLWGDKMVGFATSMLQKDPTSSEALVFAASIPLPETRRAVETLFKQNQTKSPKRWLQQQLFEKQLTDPAIHVFVKSAPREQRPGGNNGGAGSGPGGSGEELAGGSGGSAAPRRPRPGRPAKKKDDPDPEAIARKEASYDWMDASERTLLSLMDRMYQGSLGPNAQQYAASDLPFSVHKGAEVTTSMRFTLPGEKGALKNAEPTTVNYIRIESGQMNQKTVAHYRSALRDEETVTILGGNGMWLDGKVKPNKKAGTIRSLDILLSKSNARPSKSKRNRGGQGGSGSGSSESGSEFAPENFEAGSGGGGGGGGKFVVEILVVEIPVAEAEEPAVSAVSKE